MKDYLKRISSPRLKLIKQWSRDILSGLNYLHMQKPFPIIHRDLKCDNIFVSSNTGELRIGDLGANSIIKEFVPLGMMGTPRYMAPELFEERHGPSVDIYSFGMCLIEICTLIPPYEECNTPKRVYTAITTGKKPLSFDKIIDENIKEFVNLCLLPVDQRPYATELLSHQFLIIGKQDRKPVELRNVDISPESQC